MNRFVFLHSSNSTGVKYIDSSIPLPHSYIDDILFIQGNKKKNGLRNIECGSTFIFSKARIKDLIRPYNRDTSETSLDLIAQKSKYAAVAIAMKHS